MQQVAEEQSVALFLTVVRKDSLDFRNCILYNERKQEV